MLAKPSLNRYSFVDDCKGASTVLLGSDPTKLTAALTQETDCGTGSDPTYMPDAIIQALDSQVAKWVLLAIFELADLSKSFTGTYQLWRVAF